MDIKGLGLLVILTFSHKLCYSFRSDVPTFQVGSNFPAQRCSCKELNSTFHRSCGISPKVSGIEIAGNGTHFGEFPWQVAIIEKYEDEFFCSGVLLSSRIVLTAARCIQDVPVLQIKVRLGEWDILNEDKNPFETYKSVDIAVSKKYFTPEPHSNEAYHLGILKMATAVNFNEYPHIAPICIPQIVHDKANLSECIVTGWVESKILPLGELISTHMNNSPPLSEGVKLHEGMSPLDENIDGSCQLPLESMTKFYKDHHHFAVMKETLRDEGLIKGGREENIPADGDFGGSNGEPEEGGNLFSRILSKSAVKVLSKSECSKLLKQLNATSPKPNQLCVTAEKAASTCLGDIGSPVICRIAAEDKNTKDVRKNRNSMYAVAGIITQSHSCTSETDGAPVYPVLATSISKYLDQICHVVSST